MSRRIAILTPDPNGIWADSRWPEVLSRLAGPLEAAGFTVEARPWTGAALAGFDLVLPLLVWGYHKDGDWQQSLTEWEAGGAPLQNPVPVLRWNADKRYLGRFAEAGAPVVPTLYVDRVDRAVMEAAASRFGTDRLVAKPQVSAGAYQTVRWSPGAPLEGAPEERAIIQPYLPAIEAEGEISLIYFSGRFSHAIRKRPQPGDFRVQPEYDGIITPHVPTEDELAAAAAILAVAGEDLLYARIDLVRDLESRPALMELELVEPDLYLGYGEGAAARFVAAVAALVSARFGL